MYGFTYTQNDLFYLALLIQFFFEPSDLLLTAPHAVDLYTAQDHRGNAAAQKQSDNKVQHSSITSLSCGDCSCINSSSVIDSPVKFGEVSSVNGIYPSLPKSIGSLVKTDPP